MSLATHCIPYDPSCSVCNPMPASALSPADAVQRFRRAVIAYHGESHWDFEDAQSRALEMAEAEGLLYEMLNSLRAAASPLPSEPRPCPNCGGLLAHWGECPSAPSEPPTPHQQGIRGSMSMEVEAARMESAEEPPAPSTPETIDDRYHTYECAKVPKVIEGLTYGDALPPAACDCGFGDLQGVLSELLTPHLMVEKAVWRHIDELLDRRAALRLRSLSDPKND